MKYLERAENDCDRIRRNILTVNDRNFFSRIIERGKEYYEQGKVTELKKVTDDMYSAVVLGKEKYNIKVTMNGKFCRNADCSCPFNVAEGDYINPKLCKHIYATYMAIYELENKEYLKKSIIEYRDKYYSLYLKKLDNIDSLKLDSKGEKLYTRYKTDFTELYENNLKEYNDKVSLEENLKLLCELIIESAKVLDSLELLKDSYENELIEASLEQENVDDEDIKIKKSVVARFFELLGTIISGIFVSLFSLNETMNTSNDTNEFSHGEIVMVKYSGKVGVIVAVSGDYYTVKLKDEFENEYYASYYGNELEKY